MLDGVARLVEIYCVKEEELLLLDGMQPLMMLVTITNHNNNINDIDDDNR